MHYDYRHSLIMPALWAFDKKELLTKNTCPIAARLYKVLRTIVSVEDNSNRAECFLSTDQK